MFTSCLTRSGTECRLRVSHGRTPRNSHQRQHEPLQERAQGHHWKVRAHISQWYYCVVVDRPSTLRRRSRSFKSGYQYQAQITECHISAITADKCFHWAVNYIRIFSVLFVEILLYEVILLLVCQLNAAVVCADWVVQMMRLEYVG